MGPNFGGREKNRGTVSFVQCASLLAERPLYKIGLGPSPLAELFFISLVLDPSFLVDNSVCKLGLDPSPLAVSLLYELGLDLSPLSVENEKKTPPLEFFIMHFHEGSPK